MAQRQVKEFLKQSSSSDGAVDELMAREKYTRDSEHEENSDSSSDSDSSNDDSNDTIKQLLNQAEEIKKVQAAKKMLKIKKAKEEEQKRIKIKEEQEKVTKESTMRKKAKELSDKIMQEDTCMISSPKTLETYNKYLQQKTKLHREEAGLVIVNRRCAEQHLVNLKLQEEKLKIELQLMKSVHPRISVASANSNTVPRKRKR